jgi:hypothetical protein
MTIALAVAGIAVSFAALGIALASARFARRQLQLSERQHERDFEATVVAELVRFNWGTETLDYEVLVTNAGPAVARDVDISVVEWSDEGPFGERIDTVDVSPALLRGEQRTVTVRLPVGRATFGDRSRSIELASDYFDDNGVRNVRLAFVYDGELVLTPPQPPYPSERRLRYPPGS